jgi:hypothetical protein
MAANDLFSRFAWAVNRFVMLADDSDEVPDLLKVGHCRRMADPSPPKKEM